MKEKKGVLVACAATAALFVGIFDLTFNGVDSLPMKIGEAVRIFLLKGWDTYAWFGLLIIVSFGAFICFIREPKSKTSAGEIGLGIITLITTLASPISQKAVSKGMGMSSFVTRAIAQEDVESKKSGKIVLKLERTEVDKQFLIQVRELYSDSLLDTKISNSQTIELTGIAEKGKYIIYLEAEGHKWTRFNIDFDGTNTLYRVQPRFSNIPMVFQRFVGTENPKSLTAVPLKN